MKKYIVIAVLSVFAFCSFNYSVLDNPIYHVKKDTIYVAGIIGQSNGEGGTTLSYTTTYSGYQNAYIWYKVDSTYEGVPTTYNQAVNSSYRSQNSYVGPDVSLAHEFYQRTGKKLMLLKYCLGGSALVDDGVNTATAGIWQTDADYTRSSGLAHYRKFIYQWLYPFILYYQKRGVVVQFVTILWVQGESDAASAYRSQNYAVKGVELLDSIRYNISIRGALHPNYRPIISRIHNHFYPVRAYRNSIDSSQIIMANQLNGLLLETNDIEVHSDSTHYTGNGQVMHGIKAATLIVDSILN